MSYSEIVISFLQHWIAVSLRKMQYSNIKLKVRNIWNEIHIKLKYYSIFHHSGLKRNTKKEYDYWTVCLVIELVLSVIKLGVIVNAASIYPQGVCKQANMHIIIGKCNSNVIAAANLYRERYLNTVCLLMLIAHIPKAGCLTAAAVREERLIIDKDGQVLFRHNQSQDEQGYQNRPYSSSITCNIFKPAVLGLDATSTVLPRNAAK